MLAAREYNEDPVLQTMLPATWLDTARRRTILLFLRSPDGVRRMAVARYAVGDAFPSAWDPEAQPDQWSRLAELLAEADPARIGVNSSAVFPLADGLSASERAELVAHLPPALAATDRERRVGRHRLARDPPARGAGAAWPTPAGSPTATSGGPSPPR